MKEINLDWLIKEKIGIACINPRGIKIDLSIVIPVYNKYNFTKACLTDLFKLPANHEIIIIDNASSDDTYKELKDCGHPNFKYIRNEENVFHSKACNQGYRLTRGNNVLFLNNDIRINSNHSNWTKIIIDHCNSNDAVVGPTMGQLDNNLNFVKETNAKLGGNSYVSGWCIAANKNTWDKIDMDNSGQIWNEQFPFYFNDTDLSFRCHAKSIALDVISIPEVVHFGKISAAQINIPKLYSEGRQIFIKKWGSK